MYKRVPPASAYVAQVGPRDADRQAHHLRDMAERYLRMARGTDQRTHDALVVYASDLLDKAQQIEGVGADEPQTSNYPNA